MGRAATGEPGSAHRLFLRQCRAARTLRKSRRFQDTLSRPRAIAAPWEWQAVKMPPDQVRQDTRPESKEGDRICHATVTWTGRRSQDSGRLPPGGGIVRDAEVRLCLMRRFTCL